jgi:hypothetical protein
MVQSPLKPAILSAKLRSSLAPSGVCIASGGSCTPQSSRPCCYRLQGFAQRKPAKRAKSVSVE